MLNENALKGRVEIVWYEDGRMSLALPNDPLLAYGMLHAALDEVQERMQKVKQQHLESRRIAVVSKDGNEKKQEWGT